MILLLSLLSPYLSARETPAPLSPIPFALPTGQSTTLSNGIPVTLVEDHERPFVWATLTFRAGGFADPPGKEGLATLAMDLLNDAAGPYDGVQLAQAAKKLGARVTSGASTDSASLSIRALTQNLDPTLALMNTVLTQPRFDEADWAVLQPRRIAERKKEDQDPVAIADRVLNHLLFQGQYAGRAPTVASLQAITLQDIRDWYTAHLGADQATLVVGGDVTLTQIVPLLEKHLGRFTTTAQPLSFPEAPPQPEKTKIYLVDYVGGTQSVLAMGRTAGQPQDSDYLDLMAANGVFGGIFSSRLNMNLREKNGYTYGARSSLEMRLTGTVWSASTSVEASVTGPALGELLGEYSRALDDPFTDAEVAYARDYYVGSMPLKYESPDYLLGQYLSIWRYHLPANWGSHVFEGLSAVTGEGARQAWQTKIAQQPAYVVVVGEKFMVGEAVAGVAARVGAEVVSWE